MTARLPGPAAGKADAAAVLAWLERTGTRAVREVAIVARRPSLRVKAGEAAARRARRATPTAG